jgi:parallel beta-helix repeat protein
MVEYLTRRNRWRGKKGESLNDIEPGSFFYDLEKKELYVWLKDGGNPNRRCVEVSVRPFLWKIVGRDYITLAGFKMRHAHSSAHVNWAMLTVSGRFNTIENCTVEWSDYVGISISGNNHLLINSRFNHNGCAGIGGRGWGHRIIGCETSCNNYRYWNPGWHAGGMKMIPYCHDMLVSGHVSAYNYKSPGIWFDHDNSNVTIQNSICHHNGESGIFYEVSERATIKNNILYENKGRGIYISNSSYCAILHNICYKNSMSGIAVIDVDRIDPCFGRGKRSSFPACGNVVWGNILFDNCHPDLCLPGWHVRPELILPKDLDTSEMNISDYNIFYRTKERKGKNICFWKGWDESWGENLAEWQTKSGQDKHSIVAEPLFVNLAKRDFRPAKGSPAVCFAKPSQSVRYDFAGWDRIKMLSIHRPFYTAGAFEAEANLIPTTTATSQPDSGGFSLITLPHSGMQKIFNYTEFYAMVRSLHKQLPVIKLSGGKMGFTINGVPFCQTLREAVFLNKDKKEFVVPVGKEVKKMYFLLAVLNPGKKGTPVMKATVSRDDGKKVPLTWISGLNISSSLGELQPPMSPDSNRFFYTKMVCEGIGYTFDRKTKLPSRLFVTTWDNDNEWFPVREVRLELLNQNAKIMLLAVTME